jgi:glycosyltransferase involved in cell wall biosynthesis
MTSQHLTGVSVVVPVYNSEQTLRRLRDRLVSALQALGVSFEIILVDDGSRDRSWDEIRRIAEETPRFAASD